MKLVYCKILVVDSVATGAKARQERESRGISLREIARRMKLSAAYLSALETGKAKWKPAMAKRFNRAINK